MCVYVCVLNNYRGSTVDMCQTKQTDILSIWPPPPCLCVWVCVTVTSMQSHYLICIVMLPHCIRGLSLTSYYPLNEGFEILFLLSMQIKSVRSAAAWNKQHFLTHKWHNRSIIRLEHPHSKQRKRKNAAFSFHELKISCVTYVCPHKQNC